MSSTVRNRQSRLCAPIVALAVALALGALLWAPAWASASANQVALFETGGEEMTNPTATLNTLRSLGVGAIRLDVSWSLIAPDPGARTPPKGFDATDPAAYPLSGWVPYDAVVREAQADNIGILMLVGGGAPLWATGQGRPAQNLYPNSWKPSASEYGKFVQAVATRYSGRYVPPGSSSPLPRINLWELWSEPNWGPSLAPQATNGSKTSTSPAMYRALLNAGWTALQHIRYGHNTVVVGSLSPRGFNAPPSPSFPQGLPDNFSTTKPLQFVRTLYCVDSRYRQLRGSAAAAVGCPVTAAASRMFWLQNPALFEADGFGAHPYPFSRPPTEADSKDPDYVEFNEIPRLTSTLDRIQHVYGSSRRFQIYNTEYGYETNPPNASNHFVSPTTAAEYINWAEYLSWRNSRLATTMQFLLNDPNPSSGASVYGRGGFAAGLIFYHGPPKADYYAYRMPIFLPVTSTRRGRALEVWGCVRPAHFASGTQQAQIQFQAGSSGAFQTIKTVSITSPVGYIDLRLAFPRSGIVRLAWTSPSGQTLYSRPVAVTVR